MKVTYSDKEIETMRRNDCKKRLSLFVCVLLIASMALFTAACGGGKNNRSSDSGAAVKTQGEDHVLGEGKTQFEFVVADGEGNETQFEIHTDKETVGEALLELGLIAGEEGDYGLYVKTVNGITVDYDEDGKYWAFYINGEYAATGVDSTSIKEGEVYSFKVE